MRKTSLLLAAASVLSLMMMIAAPVDAGRHGRHHDDRRIEGSGDLETRDFDLDDFDAIELDGSMDIDVSFGGDRSVKVKLDDNLFDNLALEVKGRVLKIGWKESCSPDGESGMTIVMKSLKQVRIDGAGDVDIRGLKGDRFDFDLYGAGDLDVDGEVDELDVSIHGAGDVEARGLKAKRVEVSIHGAGDADVTATESFEGVVNGVGDITYGGDPEREKCRVHGIGDIERR